MESKGNREKCDIFGELEVIFSESTIIKDEKW
jgi:hypothetical protein